MTTLQKVEIYGIRHTYVEWNNSGTLAFKRVFMTHKNELKVSNTKLEFAGDGQKYTKNYGYQANGTVEASVDDTQIDGIIYGITAVAPSGGDDFSYVYYKGTDAELQNNYVGLRITFDAADVDTGAAMVVRYRIFKVQFAPDTPPAMGSEQTLGRMLAWDGHRATTDVVGNALTGIPSRGAFWGKYYITNSANFDPVPGDNL